MISRRTMISAAALAGGVSVMQKLAFGDQAATPTMAEASNDRTSLATPPLSPAVPGRDYLPVHVPNGTTLPFRVVDGVKVMHLVAEPVEHEMAPGLKVQCWGYNGRTPGPVIEAVAGDRVRIYVTNRLPEATTVHWHGVRVPNGMDGVAGLTQRPIEVGETYRYEFTVPDAGTFMYHPHFDDMTQQAMGMMGMFVVHPRDAALAAKMRVDRDYAIMLSEWRVDPGTSRPVTTEMTDFNLLTMNSKVYPATEPIVAQLGERVRIRFGNLGAMEHHPIHLHGFQMTLTETDGGIVVESARQMANTVLVPVGSTRAVEFVADNPGDWAMHCHMTHHTMNQMGHDVPNLIGVDAMAITKAVKPVVPGYMTMGTRGMGPMSAMAMDTPANTIPMMGGKGRFGAVGMGGMFTVVKVREQLKGFEDPGDYEFPSGSVAAVATEAELQRDGIDGHS